MLENCDAIVNDVIYSQFGAVGSRIPDVPNVKVLMQV